MFNIVYHKVMFNLATHTLFSPSGIIDYPLALWKVLFLSTRKFEKRCTFCDNICLHNNA